MEYINFGAIFIDHGYSATETAINGVYSISQFYEINKENLARYQDATGKTVEYGLVASVSATPDVENPSVGTFATALGGLSSNCFEIKISGIANANFETPFTFCAYVVDGDAVYYLDNGKTVTEVEQKSYVTVAQLLGINITEN